MTDDLLPSHHSSPITHHPSPITISPSSSSLFIIYYLYHNFKSHRSYIHYVMQRKLLRRSGTCNYYRCNFFQRLQVPAHLVDVKTKCTMATYDHQKLKIQINEKNNRHEDEKITTAPATTVATSPAINNTNVITILEDNPCWGSPTRHRLEDLLFLIHRNTSIVFDSPNFLVLNKPADLRMDGPYPSTVHKLLTYWYPPPSLLHGCNKKNKNSTALSSINESTEGASKNDGREIKNHNTLLLELVSRLHQHNSIADNFLRPCHQLDYATSGVLLVAKTKEGAAQVGRLLEDRDEGVQKSYGKPFNSFFVNVFHATNNIK
jgi:23S rRNA-/tRNA-specific pseudouridylate synthase